MFFCLRQATTALLHRQVPDNKFSLSTKLIVTNQILCPNNRRRKRERLAPPLEDCMSSCEASMHSVRLLKSMR